MAIENNFNFLPINLYIKMRNAPKPIHFGAFLMRTDDVCMQVVILQWAGWYLRIRS